MNRRMLRLALATGLLTAVSGWGSAQTATPVDQPAQTTEAQTPVQTPAQTPEQTGAPAAETPSSAQSAPAKGQFPAPGQVMPPLHVEPLLRPDPAPAPDPVRSSAPAGSTGYPASPQLQQRERYHIHEGDQILVEYTYTPEFNQTVTVQPDGFVTLRVGGDVRVAGRTIDEVKAMIEKSASVRLKDPVVALTLTDFQHPYFVVAGEALSPLKYEMREHLTVLQGVMLAGGIRQTGKEKQVVLIHGLGTGDQQIYLLDLKNVASNKIFEHDMDLSSGDIIYIPRNKLTRAIQVMQLINAPAGYASTAVYAFR